MNVLLLGTLISGYRPYRAVIEDLADRVANTGWEVRTASGAQTRFARVVDTLTTIVRGCRWTDVAQVDVFSGKAFMVAEVACAALTTVRVPFVLTLHGGGLPGFAARHPARVRRLMRSAAAVTAPSRYLAHELSHLHGSIKYVPNAIDVGAYRHRHRGPVTPRLLWLRAFHEIYNPPLAVRALSIVRESQPDATLLMIGPDRRDGSLAATQALVSELGLGAAVRIVPGIAKAEIPTALDAADIFVNTTNVDNTPITLLESMAAGMCLVSTQVGGIPFLVENERSAILVPKNDAAAMAAAIVRLLVDPSIARRISDGGRAVAEAHDWPLVLDAWRDVLGAAAARGTG